MSAFSNNRAVLWASLAIVCALILTNVYWLRTARVSAREQFTQGLYQKTARNLDAWLVPGNLWYIQLKAFEEEHSHGTPDSEAIHQAEKLMSHMLDSLMLVDGVPVPYRYSFQMRIAGEVYYYGTMSEQDLQSSMKLGYLISRICNTCDYDLQLYFPKFTNTYVLHRLRPYMFVSVILTVLLAGCLFLVYWGIRQKEKQREKMYVQMDDLLHNLRTPLFGLTLLQNKMDRVLAEETLSGPGREEMTKAMGQIRNATESLNDQVELNSGAIIALTSLEDAQHKMRPSVSCDIDEVIQQLIAQPAYHLTDVEIAYDRDADSRGKSVMCSAQDLQAIVQNLLDNGIKYSERAPVISIHQRLCTSTHDNTQLCLSIRDSGVGTELGDQAKIFDRNFRGRQAQAMGVAGQGLGLDLVKRLSEANQISLNLIDSSSLGTCFELRFRLRTSAEPDQNGMA